MSDALPIRCPACDAGYLLPTQASSTLFGPRDMQLGLKFLW